MHGRAYSYSLRMSAKLVWNAEESPNDPSLDHFIMQRMEQQKPMKIHYFPTKSQHVRHPCEESRHTWTRQAMASFTSTRGTFKRLTALSFRACLYDWKFSKSISNPGLFVCNFTLFKLWVNHHHHHHRWEDNAKSNTPTMSSCFRKVPTWWGSKFHHHHHPTNTRNSFYIWAPSANNEQLDLRIFCKTLFTWICSRGEPIEAIKNRTNL